MSVSVSESRSFYKNKYIEYRRKYNEAKDFSKKLDQAPTLSSTPKKSAAATKADAKADTSPKTDLSGKPEGTQTSMGTAKGQSAETSKLQADTQAASAEPFATQESTVQYTQFSDSNRTRMQEKLAPYKAYIKAAAARYDLPEELIAGFIWQESRGNPRAVSHCGAMGLMQLMPETARNLGVSNAFHPAQNIDGGAKYIRQMLDKFGKLEHAVAAYNAGPGNVSKYGGIPPFRETQDYVPRVLGGAQAFAQAGGFQDTTAPTTVRV
jgi:soluble lytic murein transglycosylase-like protein